MVVLHHHPAALDSQGAERSAVTVRKQRRGGLVVVVVLDVEHRDARRRIAATEEIELGPPLAGAVDDGPIVQRGEDVGTERVLAAGDHGVRTERGDLLADRGPELAPADHLVEEVSVRVVGPRGEEPAQGRGSRVRIEDSGAGEGDGEAGRDVPPERRRQAPGALVQEPARRHHEGDVAHHRPVGLGVADADHRQEEEEQDRPAGEREEAEAIVRTRPPDADRQGHHQPGEDQRVEGGELAHQRMPGIEGEGGGVGGGLALDEVEQQGRPTPLVVPHQHRSGHRQRQQAPEVQGRPPEPAPSLGRAEHVEEAHPEQQHP
jgi:hypothetical protein